MAGGGGAGSYRNFELDLGQATSAKCSVTVRNSPAGQAEVMVSFQPEALIHPFSNVRDPSSQADESMVVPPSAETFGRALFEQVFTGKVLSRWLVSRGPRDHLLRLRLRLGTAALAALPWELLYDAEKERHLCLDRRVALVRYPDAAEPNKPLQVRAPVKVLAMVASPKDLPGLDIDAERKALEDAIRRNGSDAIHLEWTRDGTVDGLQEKLFDTRTRWNMFHFIGHGDYDIDRDEGLIALVDSDGMTKEVPAPKLATMLLGLPSLRIVVLNACKGAQTGRNLYSNTATTLIRSGVPAVVAMQSAISNRSAIRFSQTFYGAIAAGQPIERATSEARLALHFGGDAIDWAIPVLYMKSDDGQIFSVSRQSRIQKPPPQNPLTTEAQGEVLDESRLVSRQITLKSVIRDMAEDCREQLRLGPDQVRASAFLQRSDGFLHMVPWLAYNIPTASVLRVKIKPRQGVVGQCFAVGRPLLARFRDIGDQREIGASEVWRVDRDLKWIIAIPIPYTKPALVISFDGIMADSPPPSEENLAATLAALTPWIGIAREQVESLVSVAI